MSGQFLPYARQWIDDDDVAAVIVALRSDLLTTGPLVERLESAFAEATGADHAVVCNSGTAALHLALLARDLKPCQSAVVPAITFLATANAVRMTGAEVVFADVDPMTGLMTPETLQATLSRVRENGQPSVAALPVHLNGQVCDMPGLAEVAEQNGTALIEDACHALGVSGIGATRHSTAACFSTHPAKAIATGEGGVVTTRDSEMAGRMRRLRTHGMNRESAGFANRDFASQDGVMNPWYYEMTELGWNYRLPDVLCALGLSQLEKLNRFAARRKEIASLYDRLLAPLAPTIRPVPHGDRPHGWHLYVIQLDCNALGTTRAHVVQALRAQGIGTQVHYIPLHWQPYYQRRYGDLSLPGAEAYYARCLSIPLFPAMTDADVERVAAALTRIVERILRRSA